MINVKKASIEYILIRVISIWIQSEYTWWLVVCLLGDTPCIAWALPFSDENSRSLEEAHCLNVQSYIFYNVSDFSGVIEQLLAIIIDL